MFHSIELAIVIGVVIILLLLWRVVRSAVEASKLITANDRALLQQLLAELRVGSAGVLRLEEVAAKVAKDLSDSHFRADQMEDVSHGAAADAAARQTLAEKAEFPDPVE